MVDNVVSNTKILKKETADGSITFYREDIDETYHSTTAGARTEALKKHVLPALEHHKKIQENKKQYQKETKKEYTILDCCFGLGYNTLVAVEEIKKQNPTAKIIIDAIENDPKILAKVQTINFDRKYQDIINTLAATKTYSNSKEQIGASLLLEDMQSALENVSKNKYDIIFFDPFSPQKMPELWTEDIFSKCYNVLQNNGVLTTYSCAGKVRRAMKAAGFVVVDGPVVGRRAPSTLAIKKTGAANAKIASSKTFIKHSKC